MKKYVFLFVVVLMFAKCDTAGATILYSETFTTESAVHDDGNGYYTTPAGEATSYTHLQSIDTDAYQRIEANQWNLREYNSGSGDGFYFQEIGEPVRTYYNWATSPFAADIISGGGLQMSLDVTYSDVADNNAWIEFAFGTGNSASTDGRRYDDSDVDFGFRFEGDRIDMKDNGAGVGTVSYDTSLSNDVMGTAEILLAFDSFDAGTTVNATMTIGTNVFTNSFTLDTTDDFRFSFGPGYYLDEDSIYVDNLLLQTVPEPATMSMLAPWSLWSYKEKTQLRPTGTFLCLKEKVLTQNVDIEWNNYSLL
ncbi:MAG: hypothetical protein AB7F23_02575 [Phycisphaerae bacterium]|jgi:hypothetical protein